MLKEGAVKRYDVYDTGGTKSTGFNNYPTIAMVGEYELREGNPDYHSYSFAIVCPPELRRPHRWNVSAFDLSSEGVIKWADDDVQLDPYHMCLLYQAIEKHNRRT